jgi:hypothetical protein
MWFDANAALTEIRCVKSSKAGRIDAEPKLDWISTISTVAPSQYENSHPQGKDEEKSYDAFKSVFHEYYFPDEFSPDAWR